MAQGTVKWFNQSKGYGFITPDNDEGNDVFVHITAVQEAGMRTLREAQRLSYEVTMNRGKPAATQLVELSDE